MARLEQARRNTAGAGACTVEHLEGSLLPRESTRSGDRSNPTSPLGAGGLRRFPFPTSCLSLLG
eukprot:2233447-Pyramimonas_sp.AAC.1